MARALLRRGVTSFLPTAPSLPEAELPRFADRVRGWMPDAPVDGAQPLGFNLEGPFLAPSRRGAHDPAVLRTPEALGADAVAPLLDGLRVMTIAPELPGALALIERLSALGIAASLGHSASTLDEARAGYLAGGRSTTHLFNAMTGVDHRAPGLAVAALTDDADLRRADRRRAPRPPRPVAADHARQARRTGCCWSATPCPSRAWATAGRRSAAVEVEVRDGRCTILGSDTLAGSVIALDTAVRNLVAHGTPVHRAVAAASANPAALLGADDRGRIEVGRRAHLVELDDDLRVRRVTRGAGWIDVAGATAGGS